MPKKDVVLFVTDGHRDNIDSLLAAKQLFAASGYAFCVMAVIPEIPQKLLCYSEQFKSSVLDRLKADTKQVFTDEDSDIRCEVKSTDQPAEDIVKLVLREGFTCVIKQAETKQGKRHGFEAIDMSLLRKIPCPLLLLKQQGNFEKGKFAVAIDAENDSPISVHLSEKLLQEAGSLASPLSLPIEIISCWESVVENAQHEPFVNVTKSDIARDCEAVQGYQLKNLNVIIEKSKIAKSSFSINQVKGDPDVVIPAFVVEKGISCLLLGTYSRKGLASVLLGNTVENILSTLECSVFVMKPSTFVSPVDL